MMIEAIYAGRWLKLVNGGGAADQIASRRHADASFLAVSSFEVAEICASACGASSRAFGARFKRVAFVDKRQRA